VKSKREPCYVCARETSSKNPIRPAKFFFVTTTDYQDDVVDADGRGERIFDNNNPPEYTDFKNHVACCNEHVEELKGIFRDEDMRQVTYEEWVIHTVMVT
jgi:hypothetical protein